MVDNIVIDTGPLYAFLDKTDQYHHWVANKMGRIKGPLITCEAAISETVFLMQRSNINPDLLFAFIERNDLTIKSTFTSEEDQQRIRKLVINYANLPCSFADACLVQMAETISSTQLFTLDADFTIYRTTDGQPLSLITPN